MSALKKYIMQNLYSSFDNYELDQNEKYPYKYVHFILEIVNTTKTDSWASRPIDTGYY